MQLRAFLELARFSNLPTVWSNCLAAWLLRGDGKFDALALGTIGGSLVYTGGMLLNDYCDEKFDREFRAERPIPSGRANKRAVGAGALLLLTTGTAALMCLNPWAALFLAALVVAYDLRHKGNPVAPLLMAGCRVVLVLTVAGAAAFTVAGIALAGSLGLYILAISLVARREAFGPQPVSWAGLVCLVAAMAVTPAVLQHLPPWWAWIFLLGTATPLLFVLPQSRNVGKAVGGLLAAIPLLDLWNISFVGTLSPVIPAIFLVLCSSARLLQRVAPAT